MLDANVAQESPDAVGVVDAADDLLTLNVKSLNLTSNLIEEPIDTVDEPLGSLASVIALTWAT